MSVAVDKQEILAQSSNENNPTGSVGVFTTLLK